MADRNGLKLVGFIFATVTLAVMLTTAMVVKGYADGAYSLEPRRSQPIVSSLTIQALASSRAISGSSQRQHDRDHQQSDKPDHDGAHPVRRFRNGIGSVLSGRMLCMKIIPEFCACGDLPWSRQARKFKATGNLADQRNRRAPLRKAAASMRADADQLLRNPSAVRFHCETLSAIMRVDFIAAWLSWA